MKIEKEKRKQLMKGLVAKVNKKEIDKENEIKKKEEAKKEVKVET